MSELKRYVLEQWRTLRYLQENLKETNLLSTAVLQYIDFSAGEFYTLLNKEVPSEQLYQFEWGVGGSIKDKISYFILEEFDKEKNLICLFDDVGATYKEIYQDDLFLKIGLHYEDEIYYLVTDKNKSKSILDVCFYASGDRWHSLCILSKYNTINFTHERLLTEHDIYNIIKKTMCIVVGAYDDESYVFWKRQKAL